MFEHLIYQSFSNSSAQSGKGSPTPYFTPLFEKNPWNQEKFDPLAGEEKSRQFCRWLDSQTVSLLKSNTETAFCKVQKL